MAGEENYFIMFYIYSVTCSILHMVFVIAGDFVEAFNIPPLNIGIYIDKLAAIRSLLMVVGDAIEYGILDKACGDEGKAQKKLDEGSPRRIGSILTFTAMLGCRTYYLWVVYKSNNKSLYVFVTLCIEGFWYAIFQIAFLAIGPKYNAAKSIGILSMGNFIFFFQVIMNKMSKSKPHINSLYRVRVHGWICLISSIIGLGSWLWFCYTQSGGDEGGALNNYLNSAGVTSASKFKNKSVWSPFMLFPVGDFAKDFIFPGVLPFGFLDTKKANLVNYMAPVFFSIGAIVIFFLNDVFTDKTLGLAGWDDLDAMFKLWSASGAEGWHALWALNIPKYIAFFISMLSIHGTFPKLRCIIQSIWRVILLTMFIIIPRSILEVAGYVGVANYASALAAVDTDYGGFAYIAYHDMLAMFCRFFYGKLEVGYNWTNLSQTLP